MTHRPLQVPYGSTLQMNSICKAKLRLLTHLNCNVKPSQQSYIASFMQTLNFCLQNNHALMYMHVCGRWYAHTFQLITCVLISSMLQGNQSIWHNPSHFVSMFSCNYRNESNYSNHPNIRTPPFQKNIPSSRTPMFEIIIPIFEHLYLVVFEQGPPNIY